MNPALRLVFPALFFAALIVNGVLTLAGWQAPLPLDENRELAPRPRWTSEVPEMFHALDRWLSDNFAFRKPLVAMHNEAIYYGFHSTLAPKVIVGEGPWIFGADFDAQGAVAPRRLTAGYLKKVDIALAEREAWLSERGIRMLVLFMPTKTNVYGDKYLPPAWKFDATALTESEQVYQSLSPENRAITIPVRAAILAMRETSPVYFYTDGHANQMGTFAAFRVLQDRIRELFGNKLPGRYPEYEEKLDYLTPTSFGRLMGIPFVDASVVPVPNGGFAFKLAATFAGSSELPEGSDPIAYENEKTPNVSAALIGDSFTDRMSAYFGQVFQRTTIVRMNNVGSNPDAKFPVRFLDTARPDYAVFMYVESRLVECEVECGEFPLSNSPDVRQARLRQLYQHGSTFPQSDQIRIVEIKNGTASKATFAIKRKTDELKFEAESIEVEPGESGYLLFEPSKVAVGQTDFETISAVQFDLTTRWIAM